MKTLVIGERINSSNAVIRDLFARNDLGALKSIAGDQAASGASYIDINASMLMEMEKESALALGQAVLDEYAVNICVDSADPAVLEEAAKAFGTRCLLNSLTCERDLFERFIPILSSTGAGAIVILKDGKGIPASPEGRLALAEKAVSWLSGSGVAEEKIFFDPVLSPLATLAGGLRVPLAATDLLRARYPFYNRVGGLSNISFGLPMRRLLNRTFLVMAVSYGLTAAICDPTDKALMEALTAAEAVSGLDRGCRDYLAFYRLSQKGK